MVAEFGARPLSEVCPDAGHLLHMPTHVDIICGDYEKVLQGNTLGRDADVRYLDYCRAHKFPLAAFYTLYRCHNLHFLVYGAMFDGQYATALSAAHALIDVTHPDGDASLLRDSSYFPPTGAAWLESFVGTVIHVHIRFGRWHDVLRDDALGPRLSVDTVLGDSELYAATGALLHYARGIAHAVLAAAGGEDSAARIRDAEREQTALTEAAARVRADSPPLGTRMLFNNSVGDILTVAEAMLDGELHYRRGDYTAAFDSLQRAVTFDDGLPYDEPWGWMQPARHALGALLLEQGHAARAEAVFRADLGMTAAGSAPMARCLTHPGNPWALRGLADALAQQGKGDEAREVSQRADAAAARADGGRVAAACMCAKAAMGR